MVPHLRFSCWHALAICVLAAVIAANRTAVAAAPETPWLTGLALRQALTQRVGITWSNQSLRKALTNLSTSEKLAIILDRRVDPDQKIDLSVEELPLGDVLERIAAPLHIGITLLGPVAYFGPESVTTRLRTVAALRADEVSRLSSTAKGRWLQTKPWKWEMLSAPRDLLAALGRENHVQIIGLEQIPADLWAAEDLPPLPLSDRFSLVLTQFDLTFDLASDGLSIRLIPMPAKPVIERLYSVPASPANIVTRLRQDNRLANAEFSVAGDKLVVRGRQEDQDAVSEILSGSTTKPTVSADGRKVYTLSLEMPVGKLLNALGPKLGVEIQIDQAAIDAAKISLDKKVQVNVKNVSADELLKAVLEPAGLTFLRHGNIIEVKPR